MSYLSGTPARFYAKNRDPYNAEDIAAEESLEMLQERAEQLRDECMVLHAHLQGAIESPTVNMLDFADHVRRYARKVTQLKKTVTTINRLQS